MTAIAVQIADAVVDTLNDATFEWSFTAKRLGFPTATLQEADGLTVSIFMGPLVAELFGRAGYQTTYTVYVAVQRKIEVTEGTNTVVADDLAELVEAIATELEGVDQAGYPMIGYGTDVERVAYNVEMLRDAGMFVSVLGLTYVGHP